MQEGAKVGIELAYPQEIHEFFPHQIQRWISVLEEHLATKKPSFVFNSADVFDFVDHGDRYLVMVHDKQIRYFVRVSKVNEAGMTFARQVLVWREKSSFPAMGFAIHVFFKILLPEYGALITDVQQTEKGRDFWLLATSMVLRGEHQGKVYLLDKQKRPAKLTPITQPDQVINSAPEIWGDDHPFQDKLLIVTKKALKVST